METSCNDCRKHAGGTTNIAAFRAATQDQVKCLQEVLHTGADVNSVNNKGRTLTMEAAANGNTKCLDVILSSGADVNKVDRDGFTSLILAAESGHDCCVNMLIRAGADVNVFIENWLTAILLAAQHDHAKCARLLIESGARVNACDKPGNTPLAWSIWNNNEELKMGLVNAEADVNVSFKSAACCESENNEEYLGQLLSFGTETGTIELCYLSSEVAKNGSDKALKLLLKAGADVNTPVHNMYTLLMYTAYYGTTQCMSLLIEAGAEVNFASKNRTYTALTWAVQRGHVDCVNLLLKAGTGGRNEALELPQCVKTLLEAGADVNTALSIAVSNGYNKCLDFLLKTGADVNKYYNPLLLIATTRNHIETVKMLLLANIEISTMTKDPSYQSFPNVLQYYIVEADLTAPTCMLLYAAG